MAAPSADARRCIMVAVAYDALLDLWYDIQTVLRLFNNSTVIARARVPGVAALGCVVETRGVFTPRN